MNKKNNAAFIFLSVIALLMLLLIFYLVLGLKSERVIEQQGPQDFSEMEIMEESNLLAIESAESIQFDQLRKIDETDHVTSESGAEVEIIFYGDYDDQFSSEFNRTLKRATEEFGDKIVIAFRHFPQRQHTNSFRMSLISECANDQGVFWEMHDELFNIKKESIYNQENIAVILDTLGIDEESFNECVKDEIHKDKIVKSIAEAERFTVIGTPTTYVNDIVLIGATPWEDFVDSAGFERKGLRSVIEGELDK